MSENTKLWDAVFATDPNHTKGFKRAGGFAGTAIKPLYLVHKATELWGPMGDAWGAESVEHVIHGDTVYLKARLWYPGKDGRATVEHWGGDVLVKGEGRPNDEAFKMAFTDAVGKCLVQLGFSADVHLGLFDDSKYVQQRQKAETAKARKESWQVIRDDLVACTTLKELAKVWANNYAEAKRLGEADGFSYEELERVKDEMKTLFEEKDNG